MTNASGKLTRKGIEVIIAFGQDQGRSTVSNCLDDVVADEPISRLVA